MEGFIFGIIYCCILVEFLLFGVVERVICCFDSISDWLFSKMKDCLSVLIIMEELSEIVNGMVFRKVLWLGGIIIKNLNYFGM